jgi:hypothetical protein
MWKQRHPTVDRRSVFNLWDIAQIILVCLLSLCLGQLLLSFAVSASAAGSAAELSEPAVASLTCHSSSLFLSFKQPSCIIQGACQQRTMQDTATRQARSELLLVCLLCCHLCWQTRLERAGAAAFVALLELKARDS